MGNGINYTSRICKDFGISNQSYFITVDDQHSLRNININEYDIAESSLCMEDADPDFVNAALKHIKNIKDYDPRVWDINTSMAKHSTMYVRRYSPSWCSICKRTHDNDNTLFIIFNSDVGTASWKCIRMPSMKPIVFYMSEDTSIDDSDIEAFASKHAAPKKLPKEIEEPIQYVNPKRSAYARKPLCNCNKPLPPKRINIASVDPFDEGY
jgi:hypothetical protein